MGWHTFEQRLGVLRMPLLCPCASSTSYTEAAEPPHAARWDCSIPGWRDRAACIAHLGGAAAQRQRAPPQLHEPSGRTLLAPAAAAAAVVPVGAVVRMAVHVVVPAVRQAIDGHAGGDRAHPSLRLHVGRTSRTGVYAQCILLMALSAMVRASVLRQQAQEGRLTW